MNVLITNANSSKALTVTRSLGSKGIDVVSSDTNKYAISFFSKYTKNHFLTASPKAEPDIYMKQILSFIQKKNIDVMMPINSVDTLLTSKYKYKLEQYTKYPFEDYSKMVVINDKQKLIELADEIGLPVPKTYTMDNTKKIEGLAVELSYPVVIKLKNSTSSEGLSYAYSIEDFIDKYKNTIIKYNLDPIDYPIVQQYISGDSYGASVLMNEGDLRAVFIHKRLREYPISGGPSTLRVSVKNKEMEKIAVKLLSHVKWHGLAMVEFKLDRETNKPYIIEVNPRFWGSINQAVRSGVDFPYLLYQMAIDGDVASVKDYQVGIKTRLFFNDCRAFLSYMKISNHKSQLAKDFFTFRQIHSDEFSKTDPLPGFMFFLKSKKGKYQLIKVKKNE
ncbi:ATP-grasp domain-containing protein [Methanolobus sp. ZRKC2]|uniref:carboxylate--amine ligase n=1 Tax=Methanolobus sp. ZRKC2 TaxID=3125783 RepID=UPI003253917E